MNNKVARIIIASGWTVLSVWSIAVVTVIFRLFGYIFFGVDIIKIEDLSYPLFVFGAVAYFLCILAFFRVVELWENGTRKYFPHVWLEIDRRMPYSNQYVIESLVAGGVSFVLNVPPLVSFLVMMARLNPDGNYFTRTRMSGYCMASIIVILLGIYGAFMKTRNWYGR